MIIFDPGWSWWGLLEYQGAQFIAEFKVKLLQTCLLHRTKPLLFLMMMEPFTEKQWGKTFDPFWLSFMGWGSGANLSLKCPSNHKEQCSHQNVRHLKLYVRHQVCVRFGSQAHYIFERKIASYRAEHINGIEHNTPKFDGADFWIRRSIRNTPFFFSNIRNVQIYSFYVIMCMLLTMERNLRGNVKEA